MKKWKKLFVGEEKVSLNSMELSLAGVLDMLGEHWETKS